MLYWMLLILRIIARAGLSLAVLMWLVSQFTTAEGRLEFGRIEFVGWMSQKNVNLWWYPAGTTKSPPAIMELPGIALWSSGLRQVDMRLDHWLLFITFLVGTIGTSRRWYRFESAPSERADAEHD